MQFQQTGTEPEYNDLVQFLPWGSLSAVNRAEYSSGFLKNPHPTGQKKSPGRMVGGVYLTVQILTELEHPGPTLDPHACSVGIKAQ